MLQSPNHIDRLPLAATPDASDGDQNATWADRSIYWLEQAQPPEPRQANQKRFPKRPLILVGHGIRLRVDNGALVVRTGLTHYPQTVDEVRFFSGEWRNPSRIVVIDGDGSLSFDVLDWLAAQHVPFLRLNWHGEIISIIGGGGYAADPKLARRQTINVANGAFLELSRWLIGKKIQGSIETLCSHAPSSPASERAILRLQKDLGALVDNPPATIGGILGIEGRAAAAYFGAWQAIPLRWKSLARRPVPDDWTRIGSRSSIASARKHPNYRATHPVNAMLNYAYGILENQVRIQIIAAGLDPTIGNMHSSSGGNLGLVYDLMEPLRPAVDALLLDFLANHTFAPGDVMLTDSGVVRLNPQLARNVAALAVPMTNVERLVAEIVGWLEGKKLRVSPNGADRL